MNSKKLLSMLLVSLGAFSLGLSSCGGDTPSSESSKTPSETPSVEESTAKSEEQSVAPSSEEQSVESVESVESSEPSVEPSSEPVVVPTTYAADLFVPYITGNFGGKDNKVKTATFNLPTSPALYNDNDDEVVGTITWNVVVNSGVDNAISLGGVADGKQTFNVIYDALSNEVESTVTVTGTIVVSENDTATVELSFVVPKFEFADFAKFKQLADDGSKDTVNVKGHVTAIYKTGIYFINDAGEGFYAYSPAVENIYAYSVGDEIMVAGVPTIYNGQYEFTKNCSVTLISGAAEGYAIPYTDVTEVMKNAANISDPVMQQYINAPVEVKDVVFDGADLTNHYYYFKSGENRYYFRTSSSFNNWTNDQVNKIVEEWTTGYVANIKGVLLIYNGNYYLSPIELDGSVVITDRPTNPEDLANSALETVVGGLKTSYVVANTFDLTLTAAEGGVVSYEVVEGDCASYADGKLTISPKEETSTVQLKVSVTYGNVTKDETVTITVYGTNREVKTASEVKPLIEALDASSKETSADYYFVSGVVGEIYNDQYCNFYLVDGDASLTVYGLWDATDAGATRFGNNFTGMPAFTTGDTVVLYTKLQNYSGTLELVSAQLVSYTSTPKATVYTSASTDIVLGDVTIAYDADGKLFFASYTAPGYGGPADGFYHDGTYAVVAGQTHGIFALDAQFAGWPNKLEDGTPAWSLYTVVCPEGATIVTGSVDVMLPIVNSLFGQEFTTIANNGFFEDVLVDGAYNDKVVKVNKGVYTLEDKPVTPDTPIDTPTDLTSLTLNFTTNTNSSTALTNEKALELFNAAYTSEGTVLTSVEVTKVWDGNGTGGQWPSTPGLLKLGTNSANGEIILTFAEGLQVTKVVINCHAWNGTSTDTISVNGSEAVAMATDGTATDVEFVLAEASNVVDIDVTKRGFIFTITVYFAE